MTGADRAERLRYVTPVYGTSMRDLADIQGCSAGQRHGTLIGATRCGFSCGSAPPPINRPNLPLSPGADALRMLCRPWSRSMAGLATRRRSGWTRGPASSAVTRTCGPNTSAHSCKNGSIREARAYTTSSPVSRNRIPILSATSAWTGTLGRMRTSLKPSRRDSISPHNGFGLKTTIAQTWASAASHPHRN